MKYLFFLTGLVLALLAVAIAANGMLEGWDAAIAYFPGVLGMALMFVGIVFAGLEAED